MAISPDYRTYTGARVAQSAAVLDAGLRAYMLRVYNWMTSGLLAAVVGTAASFGVVRYVMHAQWAFLPGTLAATVFGCVALMLGFGYAGTAAALRAKAAPLLRNE